MIISLPNLNSYRTDRLKKFQHKNPTERCSEFRVREHAVHAIHHLRPDAFYKNYLIINDVFDLIPVQALLEDILIDSCFQAAQQLVSLPFS